jgi:hypothetical protein
MVDLRTSFDAHSYAEIQKVLPRESSEAAREAAYLAIEWAAVFYHTPKLAKQKYKRRLRLLKNLDQLARDLNVERQSVIGGEAVFRAACTSLWKARERVEKRADEYTATRHRGHNMREEILYGELLRIWDEVLGAGRPPISRTGPYANYMITVVYEITGKLLEADTLVKITERWYESLERFRYKAARLKSKR